MQTGVSLEPAFFLHAIDPVSYQLKEAAMADGKVAGAIFVGRVNARIVCAADGGRTKQIAAD